MSKRRVVVTGLGCVTPLGNNVDTFWTNVLAGKSGMGPITNFDARTFATSFASEVKNFDLSEYLDDREDIVEVLLVHHELGFHHRHLPL